jgi:hypothetical protein
MRLRLAPSRLGRRPQNQSSAEAQRRRGACASRRGCIIPSETMPAPPDSEPPAASPRLCVSARTLQPRHRHDSGKPQETDPAPSDLRDCESRRRPASSRRSAGTEFGLRQSRKAAKPRSRSSGGGGPILNDRRGRSLSAPLAPSRLGRRPQRTACSRGGAERPGISATRCRRLRSDCGFAANSNSPRLRASARKPLQGIGARSGSTHPRRASIENRRSGE